MSFSFSRSECSTRKGRESIGDRIAVDPGFGFGKTDAHNFTLLSELSELGRMQVPVVVGLSRKATLGRVSGRAVDDRASASVAAALLAAERGANIVRVHDVAATRDALSCVASNAGRSTMSARRYFGTDGVRGTVGEAPITPEFVLRLGQATGRALLQAADQSGRLAPDGADRQGHAQFGLHAGSRAGSGSVQRRC